MSVRVGDCAQERRGFGEGSAVFLGLLFAGEPVGESGGDAGISTGISAGISADIANGKAACEAALFTHHYVLVSGGCE